MNFMNEESMTLGYKNIHLFILLRVKTIGV